MSLYEELLREELAKAEDADRALVTIARHKSEAFAEYVMRDERGRRFVNGEHHNRIHAAVRRFKRLVVKWPPEFGKSEQLTSIVLHILGRTTSQEHQDPVPLYRGSYIGSSFDGAAKTLRNIKNYIQTSADFQKVWPQCKPATGPAELWSQGAINLVRPASVRLRDPSLQALGAGGPILGARLDYAILDDTLTNENTRTPESREKYWEWLTSTVLTRLNEWGICIFLTNAWHPEDAAERLVEQGWPALIEPACDEQGVPLWPAQWSAQRVKDKLEELGDIEGPRKLFHKSRDEHSMRFTPEMVGVALERGRGLDLMDKIEPANGYRTYTGIDLGVSRTKRRTAGRTTAETAVTTVLVHPSRVRQVIDIRAGRWEAAKIMEQAVDAHRCFQSLVIVENNAAQDLFVQMLGILYPIPIRAYTTGSESAHPEFGLEKIAVEMRNGLWIIPCDRLKRTTGQVYKLLQEMYDYRPNMHVGDRLRSLQFAWEGARSAEQTVKGLRLNALKR